MAGGKLTTYRRISAEAADRVASHLGRPGRSPTAEIPLLGAGGDTSAVLTRLTQSGYPSASARMAMARYGAEAIRLVNIAKERPDLTSTLSDGRTTFAEVVHAIGHESATTVSDFTLRRTRLAWLTPDHGRKDQETIAALMAHELGWDEAETQGQIAAHEAELQAERL